MSTKIEGRDFVFTGLQHWDILMGSNARDIATEISKHNRVLYINTPLSRRTNANIPADVRRMNVLGKNTNPLRQINNNLWVLDYPLTVLPSNLLPDGILFDMVNKYNNRKMYRFARTIIDQLQFKDFILFIDNDIYRSFYAKEYLNPKLSVYYRRDNMVNEFWNRHAPRLEPQLCAKCDVVLANSEQLANAIRCYNSHAYDIGQGVDLENYDTTKKRSIPVGMDEIPRPIIGYTGMLISSRLDKELIYQLAIGSPDYSFVFVGAADNDFLTHPMSGLKNVFFMGMQESKTMPDYIASFDICINPQSVNPVTIGNYPRKIDEYLAMGKPVVATKTDAMSIFKDYVKICSGIDEYKAAIDGYIQAPDTESVIQDRIAFAHTHSWANNIQSIYDCISQELESV